MMKFDTHSVFVPERGLAANLSFYRSGSADSSAEAKGIEAYVGVQRRLLVPRVASMVMKYSVEKDVHTRLGHDCAVFAYSVLRDDTFTGRGPINTTNRFIEGELEELNVPPEEINPGSILFMNDNPLGGESNGYHFVVKASADEEEALFASKLGGSGPAVLTTMPEISRLYPAQSIGLVRDLRIRIFDES